MKKKSIGYLLLALVVINVSNWGTTYATILNTVNSVLLAACVALYVMLLHKKKIKRRLGQEKETLVN